MERRIAAVCISKHNTHVVYVLCAVHFYCLLGPNCAVLPVQFNDCNKSLNTFYRQIAIPPIKRNLLKPKTLLEKITCHKLKEYCSWNPTFVHKSWWVCLLIWIYISENACKNFIYVLPKKCSIQKVGQKGLDSTFNIISCHLICFKIACVFSCVCVFVVKITHWIFVAREGRVFGDKNWRFVEFFLRQR